MVPHINNMAEPLNAIFIHPGGKEKFFILVLIFEKSIINLCLASYWLKKQIKFFTSKYTSKRKVRLSYNNEKMFEFPFLSEMNSAFGKSPFFSAKAFR